MGKFDKAVAAVAAPASKFAKKEAAVKLPFAKEINFDIVYDKGEVAEYRLLGAEYKQPDKLTAPERRIILATINLETKDKLRQSIVLHKSEAVALRDMLDAWLKEQ